MWASHAESECGKHVRDDRQVKKKKKKATAGSGSGGWGVERGERGAGPVRVADETAGTFDSGPGSPDGWDSCGGGGV